MSELYPNTRRKMSEDFEQYAEGDLSAPGMFARMAGNVGSGIGETVGHAMEMSPEGMPSTLDPISGGLLQIAATVAEKGWEAIPGKEKVAAWIAEDPVRKRDFEMMFDFATAGFPIARGARSGVNAMGGTNLPTHLQGFYSGFRKKAEGLLKEGVDSVWATLEEAYNPQALANVRVKGTGKGRIRELETPGKPRGTRAGNLIASDAIAEQQGKTGTIAQNTITANKNTIQVADWTDTKGVKQIIKGTSDAPDEVVEAMRESLGKFNELHGKEKALATVTNLWNKRDVPLVRQRNMDVTGSTLRAELQGTGNNYTPQFTRLVKTGKFDELKEVWGLEGKPVDQLTPGQWKEYMNFASVFRNGLWDEGRSKLAPKTKGGNPYPPGKLQEGYLNARRKIAKGIEPSDVERQQYAFVKSEMRRNPANLKEMPNGLIRYGESWKSQAKDLGGVSGRFVVDTKTGKVYGSIIDGHDMMGMDPHGARKAWTITPLDDIDMAKKYKTKGDPEAIDYTGRDDVRAAQVSDTHTRLLEEQTGIKRKPSETDQEYDIRVLREYQAPVTPRDYAQALLNGVLTGGLMSNVAANSD